MKKIVLFAFILFSVHTVSSQDFYIGIGGTFVTSEFDASSVNTELSKIGINNIDDIRYNNWGLTAQARFKITKKLGVNASYSYIFSSQKNVEISSTVNLGGLGNQTLSAHVPTNISANNYSLDLTYSVLLNKTFDLFAIAGADFSEGKITIDVPAQLKALANSSGAQYNDTIEDSVVGFNFGAGITTKYGIYVIAKSRHDLSQYQATLGYLYKF
ncbi:MAG: outer membrane beta-barrel protein [Flavobacteriales bacterium]|nr:outer membrane beta-barrel protein [Flavobacteriales bacterium]